LFLFCILQQLTCETSPKIQTKRGKTRERNSKQKNWPENEPKRWPGLPLGRPKTLAQMPEGYAFALLIAQWKIFSEIIQ
jgi:hypothetical protein